MGDEIKREKKKDSMQYLLESNLIKRIHRVLNAFGNDTSLVGAHANLNGKRHACDVATEPNFELGILALTL
jgi:hypothetical protein